MVAQRRIRPLGVVFVAALAVLVARAFWIQVVEHEVWAAQAVSFRTSSRLVPYHRGKFLDREGRVLVADEDVAAIEFTYRDFRRGHPLGIAAHARTAIEGRPVTLAETEPELETWCRRLASLAPDDVAAFARGGALRDAGGVELAEASTDPSAEARSARAADLRFYAGVILRLSPPETGALRRRIEEGHGARPWSELVAGVRRQDPASILDEVARRAADARADLAELATRLSAESLLPADGGAPLARLLDLLDARRAAHEDEAADQLFQAACGFAPGRLPTEALSSTFDVAWIARALRWDAERLARWVATRRESWERELDEVRLPRILARAGLADSEGARAQRLLDGLADLWRAGDRRAREERAWSELDEVVFFHEARSLFERPRAKPPRTAAPLPFQDEDWRALAAVEEDPWRVAGLLFEAAAQRAGLASPDADEIAARWRALSGTSAGFGGEEALDELGRAARAIEAGWSAAVLRACATLRGPAAPDGSPPRPLALLDARLDRAAQRERYVLVDAQSRAARLAARPSHGLVMLVARDPARHAGFSVRDTTRRVARVHDARGVPAAGLLIGATRRPFLKELLARSEDERRLADLQQRLLRSEAEERELRDLTSRAARVDEWTGDHGLEAWFDAELTGRFGLYETEGLDALERDADSRFVPAVDGLDVTLTIDARLQVAAQDVLAAPRFAPGAADRTWFENPVGAIVLLSPLGEVLAAASEPGLPGLASVPGRGRERSVARERTLQAPTFNPPGSVFKPFVSAWAIDRLGFEPRTRYACALNERGVPEFLNLRCNAHHVESDLHHALVVSCNSYFAQLGLACEPEALLAAAHAFGFGEPTGARFDPGAARRGLREDWRAVPRRSDDEIRADLASTSQRLRFPNGLGLLWATPMQVARATAGLATGVLPEIRLVRTIGGVPVPAVSRPLPLAKQSLDVVRDALRGVVLERGGSAHGKGLDAASLGFTFACKTGSADIGQIVEVPGMPDEDRAAGAAGKSRKHAWVAGWFPAEDPAAVVVVYLHNLTETSSRTAVHVAAQFLQTPQVREFVARRSAQ
ncbi:MAG: hypothetical protein JNK02_14110 [Planctomycetes bacterium]|nr:hypothetical protein [Planctomycetota bacterium]